MFPTIPYAYLSHDACISVKRRDRPQAWDSERLYPWGKTTGDRNMIDERAYYWDMYRCHKVKLNGLVGAPFYNKRFYDVHVSESQTFFKFLLMLFVTHNVISRNSPEIIWLS